MKQKNKKAKILLLLLVTTVLFTFSVGCTLADYGESFTTVDELKSFISGKNIIGVKYPSYLGQSGKKSSYEYVCSKVASDEKYSCYKLYHFSEKYSYSVYYFFEDTEKYTLKSDKRAEFSENLTFGGVTVTVSLGKITDEEQFVIFGYIFEGKQIEIRISGRTKETKIFKGNDCYNFALAETQLIMQSMV